jgi:hypothetical protein
MSTQPLPNLVPHSLLGTASQVRKAEDGWVTRDPERMHWPHVTANGVRGIRQWTRKIISSSPVASRTRLSPHQGVIDLRRRHARCSRSTNVTMTPQLVNSLRKRKLNSTKPASCIISRLIKRIRRKFRTLGAVPRHFGLSDLGQDDDGEHGTGWISGRIGLLTTELWQT